ncbi:hypothetical protein L915_03808, partial [Phytophthora nicotianae]
VFPQYSYKTLLGFLRPTTRVLPDLTIVATRSPHGLYAAVPDTRNNRT